MTWVGKLLGAFFGLLIAGPIGLIIGLFIGHFFDKGRALHRYTPAEQARIQQVFFKATFAIMGHIAKVDGQVSSNEINAATAAMDRLNLSAELRRQAIEYFNQGKQADFNLEQTLTELTTACHRHYNLLRLFLEIQMQVAMADGQLTAQKQQLLQLIAQRIGVPFINFSFFESFFNTYQQYQQQQNHNQGHYQGQYRSSYQSSPPRNKLKEAYQLLGVAETASETEIKRAYRRLMSQNHPDKLVAKGLPESMVKLATEKTQRIQAAYDLVKNSRAKA